VTKRPRTGYCQECDSLELFSTVRRGNFNLGDYAEARQHGGDPYHVTFFCGHKTALVVGKADA
jgi:hypothetical protein